MDNYQLTDIEKLLEELLIGFLVTSKVEKVPGLIIGLTLRTPKQQLEMCQYLSDNPEATEAEIIAAAERVARGPAPSLLNDAD